MNPWQRIERWCGLHGNLFGFVPVIVYQMAKVGSSSIVAALSEAGHAVSHIHRMDCAHLDRIREQRRALGWSHLPIARHDRLGLSIRRSLLDRGGRARLVTLVRDPIARNLSSYFENLDAIWRTPNAHEHLSTEELIHGFRERFPHDEPLTWFDDELLATTGIDIYDQPFDPSGHITIRTDRFELLVLRSELPDEQKSAALSDFIGGKPLRLTPANRTSQKAVGEAYQRFVAGIRFDSEDLDRMLDSRYTRHFYSTEERNRMRQRYSR